MCMIASWISAFNFILSRIRCERWCGAAAFQYGTSVLHSLQVMRAKRNLLEFCLSMWTRWPWSGVARCIAWCCDNYRHRWRIGMKNSFYSLRMWNILRFCKIIPFSPEIVFAIYKHHNKVKISIRMFENRWRIVMFLSLSIISKMSSYLNMSVPLHLYPSSASNQEMSFRSHRLNDDTLYAPHIFEHAPWTFPLQSDTFMQFSVVTNKNGFQQNRNRINGDMRKTYWNVFRFVFLIRVSYASSANHRAAREMEKWHGQSNQSLSFEALASCRCRAYLSLYCSIHSNDCIEAPGWHKRTLYSYQKPMPQSRKTEYNTISAAVNRSVFVSMKRTAHANCATHSKIVSVLTITTCWHALRVSSPAPFRLSNEGSLLPPISSCILLQCKYMHALQTIYVLLLQLTTCFFWVTRNSYRVDIRCAIRNPCCHEIISKYDIGSSICLHSCTLHKQMRWNEDGSILAASIYLAAYDVDRHDKRN